ncbi:MAG TPA: hypothetical protein VN980_15540 [Alphaproteobacteria bacterium]|nr:hypothetical protein [Alphaproteobacteria bacterium]
MSSFIVNLVVKLLLRFVPGIGPIAPAIATTALKLGALEGGAAYAIVKGLVGQAEHDPALKDGAARFEWVLPKALAEIAEAQPGIAHSLVRFMIETAVQELA